MNGLFFDGKLTYRTDLPEPEPAKGEALIKVTKAGICRTDLEIVSGYMNFTGVPGHEFVGVVEQADDKTLVGERVVGDINCGCGNCSACRTGNENHCPKRTVLGILGRNGAFAEKIALPSKNLFALPDSISDDEAVFVEPIAAAYRIAEQTPVRGKTMLVLGDGKLGLLIAQVMKALNAEVTVCGRHSAKLNLIAETGVVTLLESDLPQNRLFEITVDATGRPEGLELALKHTRPKGTLVLKTTVAKSGFIDYNQIVINEITLVGSRCGPFEYAITLMEAGGVKVKNLVEKTFPLNRGIEAFQAAGKPGAMKILIG